MTEIIRLSKRDMEIFQLIVAVVRGFEHDPGHSDLDNEQPIHVSMTLGDYRRAKRLWHYFKEDSNG